MSINQKNNIMKAKIIYEIFLILLGAIGITVFALSHSIDMDYLDFGIICIGVFVYRNIDFYLTELKK